tara:strand:+ start:276 stop:449 length:174 start_codon:yes stop_codon:yes gene_type:complete
MENLHVTWINYTGQKQERVFTKKAGEKFIEGLKEAAENGPRSRLKFISSKIIEEVRS